MANSSQQLGDKKDQTDVKDADERSRKAADESLGVMTAVPTTIKSVTGDLLGGTYLAVIDDALITLMQKEVSEIRDDLGAAEAKESKEPQKIAALLVHVGEKIQKLKDQIAAQEKLLAEYTSGDIAEEQKLKATDVLKELQNQLTKLDHAMLGTSNRIRVMLDKIGIDYIDQLIHFYNHNRELIKELLGEERHSALLKIFYSEEMLSTLDFAKGRYKPKVEWKVTWEVCSNFIKAFNFTLLFSPDNYGKFRVDVPGFREAFPHMICAVDPIGAKQLFKSLYLDHEIPKEFDIETVTFHPLWNSYQFMPGFINAGLTLTKDEFRQLVDRWKKASGQVRGIELAFQAMAQDSSYRTSEDYFQHPEMTKIMETMFQKCMLDKDNKELNPIQIDSVLTLLSCGVKPSENLFSSTLVDFVNNKYEEDKEYRYMNANLITLKYLLENYPQRSEHIINNKKILEAVLFYEKPELAALLVASNTPLPSIETNLFQWALEKQSVPFFEALLKRKDINLDGVKVIFPSVLMHPEGMTFIKALRDTHPTMGLEEMKKISGREIKDENPRAYVGCEIVLMAIAAEIKNTKPAESKSVKLLDTKPSATYQALKKLYDSLNEFPKNMPGKERLKNILEFIEKFVKDESNAKIPNISSLQENILAILKKQDFINESPTYGL